MDLTPLEGPYDETDGWLAQSTPTVHRWALTDPVEELGNVRAWARSLLGGQDHDRVADAMLVLDSLVTGAFDAERAPREVRLTILSANSQLLVEVDAHDSLPTIRNGPSAERVGRLLLEQLTSDWGIKGHGRSQRTWAAVDLTT